MTRFLGQNGIKVVTRLMGLILAVVGVQMLITGIRGAIELSARGVSRRLEAGAPLSESLLPRGCCRVLQRDGDGRAVVERTRPR